MEEGSGGGGGGGVSPGPNREWVQFNEGDKEDPSKPVQNGEEPKADPLSQPTSLRNKSPAAVIESSVEIVPPPSSKVLRQQQQSQSSPPRPNHNQSSYNHGSQQQLNVANLQNVELKNSETNGRGVGGGGGVGGSGAGGRRNASGFTNGDVIVSVLPTNTRWPWVTPASFRPELVPEELMVPGLTLTVEEYVHAMELLTSDLRFNAYVICYKRLLASWLMMAFLILLIILFSGVVGIGLFALGISWLIINAGAVFACMYIKIKINQGLERSMGRVNKLLIKHKLIVGLDDRGRISCHKVHLCFIYFDPTDCIKRLEQILDASEDRQRIQRHLDSTDVEIVITGSQNPTRIAQKQSQGLYLRYLQRWAKDYLRELATSANMAPLHCPKQLCPCQYIHEVIQFKKQSAGCILCQNIAESSPIGQNTF